MAPLLPASSQAGAVVTSRAAPAVSWSANQSWSEGETRRARTGLSRVSGVAAATPSSGSLATGRAGRQVPAPAPPVPHDRVAQPQSASVTQAGASRVLRVTK